MYTINYHTGVGNTTSESLLEAKRVADSGLCYTQEPVTIENDVGKEIARRRWFGTVDGLEECENPIQFGTFGFYGDWEDF